MNFEETMKVLLPLVNMCPEVKFELISLNRIEVINMETGEVLTYTINQ